MKKQILTLLATLSLTTVPLSVLAQESQSSEIETSIVDEGVLIEDYGAVYRQETTDYIAMLSNIIHNATADKSNVEAEKVDNQLILDYVQKLVKFDVATEEAAILKQKLVELTEDKVALKDLILNMDETDRLGLSQATLAYLKQMQGMLLTEEGDIYNLATNEQIELTWQLVKVAKEYGFILEDNKEKFESLSLELGAAEFHRLVTTSFNEDGSFKDKLYSKHMTELYKLLKDKKADFMKEYQERYDNILKQIEEKRVKGETVSQEELQKVEEAVAKVQTKSHREVVQSTKEQGQPTSPTVESTPAPHPVEPTPAPDPVIPAFQPDGITQFWTFDEADNVGYASLGNNNVTRYNVQTAIAEDGTVYYQLTLFYDYQ